MKLHTVYLIIAIVGMVLPIFLVANGMNNIGWNMQVAIEDLDAFFVSVFGQVVLTGYFLAGLSLTIFVIYEASARSDYYLLWSLLVLVIFGIGAALPFYLYLRMPKQG